MFTLKVILRLVMIVFTRMVSVAISVVMVPQINSIFETTTRYWFPFSLEVGLVMVNVFVVVPE